jgi:hypothetical protein
MLPRRPLPMTVGQTTLHELTHVGERFQRHDGRDFERPR